MHSVKWLVVALRRTAWLSALLALALYAIPTEAGPAGGGGRRRGGPSKPANPLGQDQGQPQDLPAGSAQFGRVIKYKPAADDKDENLLGVLSFDPQGKSSKKVDLRVIKEPEPVIDVPDAGNFRIELDQMSEIIKGLYCDASWDLADPTEAEKKNAKKNLVRLSLTTIEVVGKIEEIGTDYFKLKVRPKGSRTWPDLQSKAMDEPVRPGNNPAATAKVKPVPFRSLTLKVLDEATRFVDSANKSLDPGDFQVKQSIEAKIVYGKAGILVVLIDPNSKSGTEEGKSDDRPTGGGRGRPKVPPPG